jgi:hypothetical protein
VQSKSLTQEESKMTRKLTRFTGLAAALASVAMMVAPAAGSAAPVKFGAKLDPTVQPSNSLPGLPCIPDVLRYHACTMVQNEAYGRPDGGHIAPKTGIVKRIRLIAGGPGTMRIQTAKVKQSTLFTTKEAKLVHKGPKRTGKAAATGSSPSRSICRSRRANSWRSTPATPR